MALLSIEPFLAHPEEVARYRSAEAAACRKVIDMLLEGIATHALDLDRAARQSFRERIAEIGEGMGPEATAEALIENAGSAVQAIGEYARQATRLVRSQGSELRNLAALLARTANEMGATGVRSVSRLRKIGLELERLVALMGVSALKARVRDCLEEVGKEAKQQETESERMVQTLRREISHTQEAGHSAGADPVAGQPGELVAQAQLLSALLTNHQQHVAVFVLSSARHINLHLGPVAGDEMVRALKHYLSGHLGSNDRMFRWSGPAIVASLAGAESFEQVHSRVSRLVAKTIERTFEIHGRPVSIPLSIAWDIFSLSLPLAELNRQINEFIAKHDCPEEDPIPA